MTRRRNVSKVLCIGLTLAIAVNLLLVFYTKGTLQKVIPSSLRRELYLPKFEWNKAVIKRLSPLEVDLQHLSKFITLTWRGSCVCLGKQTKKKGMEEKMSERSGSYLSVAPFKHLALNSIPLNER